MAKVHLFLSARPLHKGETVVARCGDVVTKSEILHAWDSTPTNAKIDWPSIGICSRCIKSAGKKHEGPLFVYAIKERVKREQVAETV